MYRAPPTMRIREREREGGRKGGREGGRKGGRKRERGREGGREGGREKEGEREGGSSGLQAHREQTSVKSQLLKMEAHTLPFIYTDFCSNNICLPIVKLNSPIYQM